MEDRCGDQIEFTNAFNNQRRTLAGFAHCLSEEELHIVRDGFYLGLASDLRLADGVNAHIITDSTVAASSGKSDSFQRTVESARASGSWNDMVYAVKEKAESVGSDLEAIWACLEKGRLEWLAAASAAHPIKMTLLEALAEDKGATDGDVSDAKMVWIYALALSIPALQEAADVWRMTVGMKDKARPLVGYDPTLWDPRKPEWAPLDLGAQAAAERGGSCIEEAWAAK